MSIKPPAERSRNHWWRQLGGRKQNEILAIFWGALIIILALSLVRHSAWDTDLNAASNQHPAVHNLVGQPGAYISSFLLQMLGKMAYLFPPLLMLALYYWLRSRLLEIGWVRITGVALVLGGVCGWLGLDPKKGWEVGGGILGAMLAKGVLVFGWLGGRVILAAGVLIGILLATDVHFYPLLQRLYGALKKWAVGVISLKEEEAPRPPRRSRARTAVEEAEDPAPLTGFALGDWAAPMETEPAVEAAEEVPLEDLEVTDHRTLEFLVTPKVKSAKPVKLELDTKAADAVAEDEVEMPPAEEKVDDTDIMLQSYQLPPLNLLRMNPPNTQNTAVTQEEVRQNSIVLERTLREFGIEVKVVGVQRGPVITRYELEPPPGVRVNKITSLADNLAMALKASPIRVLAPIPGKGTIGVEVPNRERMEVQIGEIISSDAYLTRRAKSKLTFAMGRTLSGEASCADLTEMPHLLIAGTTGSGKSVCLNSIITSLLYNCTPDELKFLMVDPKRVELRLYDDIPHLMAPVVTDPRRAGAALKWVVAEMETRFMHLAKAGCRDIRAYNQKMSTRLREESTKPGENFMPPFLPYIVVVIDELADLMTMARADTEVLIARLAQMARAVGIHLVIATQRPSVNVITGVIKANFPSRIAFQVSSKVDSRTVLDQNGADALLGRGDMLFSSAGGKLVRLQGCYLSLEELEAVTDFIRKQRKPEYLQMDFTAGEEGEEESMLDKLFDTGPEEAQNDFPDDDDIYIEARQIVLDTRVASTSLLQRRLKIGYGRAARLLDRMEEDGIVGPPRGSRPREVLLDAGEA